MKKTKSFVSGFLTCALLVSMIGTAFAVVAQRQATLNYMDIKISLNGEVKTPTDANGNVVEPFAIDGTTYLPVRAVSNMLGIDVGWDQATKTVLLTGNAQAVMPAVPFTLGTGNYIVGEDIPAGKYDCTAISGSGNFTGEVESLGWMSLNEILAAKGDPMWGDDRATFNNLVLASGDTIRISGDLVVEFTKN